MRQNTDKRLRASLFRTRLTSAMRTAGSNQTALAQKIGVDRSTISQLLKADGTRLPNAHLVGSCAEALGISSDWLLGLSDRPENAADLVATSLSMTQAKRALVDDTIFGWYQEADGYKIRYVPAMLPDMLKTRAVLDWEYEQHLGKSASQAIAASQERLNWMRQSQSDYEICIAVHEIESFTAGTGYYSGLAPDIRRAQIDHWIELSETLYPRLRLYLFCARQLYSAPITIFGPLLAALYMGSNYLVFRDTNRIAAMTDHFDDLLRKSDVTSRALPDFLRTQKTRVNS
ncbi:MAG: helix-turn-helix domain-containing protein [Pelagimonas sp.]|uniref:helix-turn-helix domain-containing protein n=1 Tax=Pelagimonas sp. TaxID=2073170 RepID=UPI003D6B402B